jgi:phosphatidylglycerophosphatase A
LPLVHSNRAVKTNVQGKLILLCATAGSVGYVPIFPGTVGTLVAMPFSLCLNRLGECSPAIATMALVGAIFCAIALATKAAGLLHRQDPGVIVADEIVGFLLATSLLP